MNALDDIETPDDTVDPRALPVREQQAFLLRLMGERGGWDAATRARVEAILKQSEWLSFGNPDISRAAMSRRECRERRAAARVHAGDPSCGAANMVPLYNPKAGHTPPEARVCIDQYEFPNLACEYPLVWMRSREAAELCSAVGKRLCDAHEWEGGCAGALLPVEDEYPWANMPSGVRNGSRRDRRLWLEYEHNRTRDVRWAYGTQVDHPRCATGAKKDARCSIVDWRTCGTNSYPAGSFPECVSPLGVYDQHGNVAEHMNLPLEPDELSSAGGMGWTEMKGSWFIYSREQTHLDDCRWRAKNWHTTRVMDRNSHRNYHLGFRCCKDLKPNTEAPVRPE